jgi:hypothetical protein
MNPFRGINTVVGVILAGALSSSNAWSADLILGCNGKNRIVGTGSEQSIYFEIEFYWTSDAYKSYRYPDGETRELMDQGRAREDDNTITFDGNKIDRHTGSMVNRFRYDGNDVVQTVICTTIT